jgi:hypothetical protein
MKESNDRIRRDLPVPIEVLPRQRVVALGEVARDQLILSLGLEPSDALITQYVRDQRRNQVFWVRFNKYASKLIEEEYYEALRISGEKGGTQREIGKRAKELVKAKYMQIGSDPKRNYSFLDEIVLRE